MSIRFINDQYGEILRKKNDFFEQEVNRFLGRKFNEEEDKNKFTIIHQNHLLSSYTEKLLFLGVEIAKASVMYDADGMILKTEALNLT